MPVQRNLWLSFGRDLFGVIMAVATAPLSVSLFVRLSHLPLSTHACAVQPVAGLLV